MILQVWDRDGKLALNKTVANENEGLGIGLQHFQRWADHRRANEDEAPSVKTRKHPNDKQTTWDIGIAWHGESVCNLACDDGRIVVLKD